jgi:hypothetical protein
MTGGQGAQVATLAPDELLKLGTASEYPRKTFLVAKNHSLTYFRDFDGCLFRSSGGVCGGLEDFHVRIVWILRLRRE